MAAENPYRPPAVISETSRDRLAYWNLNHAGVPLLVAFVIGPVLTGGLAWFVLNGRFGNNPDQPETATGFVFLGLACFANLAALIYAFRVPVIWLEIGPSLRYATIAARHEVQWDDVQRIWFDREDYHWQFMPFARVTVAEHHVLVIQINDYKDLRFLVPTKDKSFLALLMVRHPNFKHSPFDDESEHGIAGAVDNNPERQRIEE